MSLELNRVILCGKVVKISGMDMNADFMDKPGDEKTYRIDIRTSKTFVPCLVTADMYNKLKSDESIMVEGEISSVCLPQGTYDVKVKVSSIVVVRKDEENA